MQIISTSPRSSNKPDDGLSSGATVFSSVHLVTISDTNRDKPWTSNIACRHADAPCKDPILIPVRERNLQVNTCEWSVHSTPNNHFSLQEMICEWTTCNFPPRKKTTSTILTPSSRTYSCSRHHHLPRINTKWRRFCEQQSYKIEHRRDVRRSARSWRNARWLFFSLWNAATVSSRDNPSS